MAGASGGELAGQVSAAGGFGFLSAGLATFWRKPQSSLLDLLPIALEHNVQGVWFAFGERLGDWIQFVRDHDQRMGKEQKTLIFVQVSTVEEALIAIKEWKVDCVVAQGIESGGHGSGHGLPLLNLLPLILSAIPADGPPILAAGGMANGGHLAAVLSLGASGAVLGTRFLLAHESLYSDAQRKALVNARSDQSVRSMAWDHARNTLGWPTGVDGRGLRNSTVDDFEKGVDMEILKSKFTEGVKKQDTDRITVWAGTGVGQMSQTQTAKSIVDELHEDCVKHLDAVSQVYS
ncbi:NPD-domain-containing protein [Mycena rebaudengoi]|nr:NPD-domain-containing protein [Mycena rebaudengoi]